MATTCIAVIADIHGILPTLEDVLSEISAIAPDEIVVAGDFLGGPQPRETLRLLQDLKCKFIVGNGEINMLKMRHGEAPDVWWTHQQFAMARWTYDRLDAVTFDFLEGLPEQLVIHPANCEPLRVVHGAPWDVNKLVFPNKEPGVLSRALAMVPEDVLVFAHTHLPNIYHRQGKLAINPGSVSNNLDGDPRASYAVLRCDGGRWHPELHYVPIDLNTVKQAFIETGFLKANGPLARAFLESVLTGENTVMDYILFAFQQARQTGKRDLQAVPDQIWLESEAEYPWKVSL